LLNLSYIRQTEVVWLGYSLGSVILEEVVLAGGVQIGGRVGSHIVVEVPIPSSIIFNKLFTHHDPQERRTRFFILTPDILLLGPGLSLSCEFVYSHIIRTKANAVLRCEVLSDRLLECFQFIELTEHLLTLFEVELELSLH
jgi:hypothetical protein